MPLCMGQGMSDQHLYVGPVNSCRESGGYAWILRLQTDCSRVNGLVVQQEPHGFFDCEVDICPSSSVTNASAYFVMKNIGCPMSSVSARGRFVTESEEQCPGVGTLRCRYRLCSIDGGMYSKFLYQ